MPEQTRRTVLKGMGATAALAFGGAGVASARRGPPSAGPTIVDIAIQTAEDTGEFSTLVAAVVEAGLVEALGGNDQLTVFAPTNAAFAAVGITTDEDGNLEVAQGTQDLLASAGLSLADVLLYHVAEGRRISPSVVNAPKIETLSGETVDVDDTELNDGQANIVDTDIMASNGIVHVIDGLLLP